MDLRSYQQEALHAIWNDLFIQREVLCVLPTGGGKTRIMAAFIEKAIKVKPDVTIAVLVGKIDLVTQTERVFLGYFPKDKIGVWCGSLKRREKKQIIVTSIQSADVRDFPVPNIIIVDEVHRLNQSEGVYLKFIKHAFAQNLKTKLIGFTATPFRDTGTIYGEDKLFKRISYRKTLNDMITMGFLVTPKLKGSTKEFDTSKLKIRAGDYRQEDVDQLVSDKEVCKQQVVDALSRMPDRQSVAWACANIDHCNMVADVLMSLGERVVTVHSKLDRENRNNNLSAFLSGSFRHVSFVSILSEGFDHPPIDCIVFMRPTRSPILYVQTIGRGLRPFETKTDCLVLDYGQVIKNLGPLDSPYVKNIKEVEKALKECPQCNSFCDRREKICPECEFVFPVKEKPPQEVAKKLDPTAFDGSILSIDLKPSEPEVFTASKAIISMHMSKSGNECVKITYYSEAILSVGNFGISEFFVTSNKWAMERFQDRVCFLVDYDNKLPNLPLEKPLELPGPILVKKQREGKYEKVLDAKLKSYIEEELDDSFDFGFNKQVGNLIPPAYEEDVP